MKKTLNTLLLIAIFQLTVLAQLTANSSYRRAGILNGNRVHTVFTNYGVIAQPALDKYPRMAWKYDHNGYIGDLSILIGVELPIKDYTGDSVPDTIHSVKITAVNRPGGGKYDPSGDSWMFEPLPGYSNPLINEDGRGVAVSTQPDTWPTSWADHPEWGSGVWNGLLGENVFTGSQEAFFKMDDSNDPEMYENYGFLSDPTDTNKKGTGLEVSTRYIQFADKDFQDVLFRIYDITNTGATDYKKVVYGNLTGTYVGIEGGEYNDDVSLFYPKDNAIITSDFDSYITPSSNPDWKGSVGKVGEKFLSAPSQNKIASFDYYVPGSNIKMSDNNAMWKILKPGSYLNPKSVTYSADSIPTASNGEDGDYIYGTDYFSLNAKATQRIISAVAFGNTDSEVLMKLKKAEVLANCNFDTSTINNAITFQKFSVLLAKAALYGTIGCNWTASQDCNSVEIWYSSDAGRSWVVVTRDAPNNGFYIWNTSLFKNSPIGLLRLFAKKDGVLIGYSDSKIVSIANGTSENMVVQLEPYDSGTPDDTVTADTLSYTLYAASTKDVSLTLQVLYSLDDSTYYRFYDFSVANSTELQRITLDAHLMPNSKTFHLKFMLTDGVDTVYDITPMFQKQTSQTPVKTSSVSYLTSSPDAIAEPRIVNRANLTNHKYRVTFVDTAYSGIKTLSIYDVTDGKYNLKDFRYSNDAETPVFDGMTLYISDFETCLDADRTKWSTSRANNMRPMISRFKNSTMAFAGVTPPVNYCIVVGNNGTYSSDTLPAVSWTGASGILPGKSGINFNMYSITKDNSLKHVKFYYADSADSLANKLSIKDALYPASDIGTPASYQIYFGYASDMSTYTVPSAGDTLWIYTKKGLTIYDTLIIDAPNAIKENSTSVIKGYQLYQNYPNPFNPSTTITYSLPEQTHVTLSIYNQLGQRIALLYSGENNAGTHSAVWNANNFASGVYFYELRTDKFTSVKKLMLLK
jgi:hypothetical protein